MLTTPRSSGALYSPSTMLFAMSPGVPILTTIASSQLLLRISTQADGGTLMGCLRSVRARQTGAPRSAATDGSDHRVSTTAGTASSPTTQLVPGYTFALSWLYVLTLVPGLQDYLRSTSTPSRLLRMTAAPTSSTLLSTLPKTFRLGSTWHVDRNAWEINFHVESSI